MRFLSHDSRFNHTAKRFHDINKRVDVSAFGKVVCCTNMLGPKHSHLPGYDHDFEYFEPMVGALETNAGYRRNQDVFAGPYDWRYGGGERVCVRNGRRFIIDRSRSPQL